MGSVGETIRRLRKARRMPQKELAHMLGMSQAALSKWELGEVKIDADAIPAIAGALGVSPGELFGQLSSQYGPLPEVPRPPYSDFITDRFLEQAAADWPDEARQLLRIAISLRNRASAG